MRSCLALLSMLVTASAFRGAPIAASRLPVVRASLSLGSRRVGVAAPRRSGSVVHAAPTTRQMTTDEFARSRPGRQQGPTATHVLLLASYVLFVADKVFRVAPVTLLYLDHARARPWQLLTACFCHADRAHLSGNAFLLLLFGRSLEDEIGGAGLLFTFAFCGVAANIVSLMMLPRRTVSLGASGAVFGLFAVSILSRLGWRELITWHKVIEVLVLGEFVLGRLLSEAKTAAGGGIAGVNHVAHLAGAGAGLVLVILMRVVIANAEAPARALRLRPTGERGYSLTLNAKKNLTD